RPQCLAHQLRRERRSDIVGEIADIFSLSVWQVSEGLQFVSHPTVFAVLHYSNYLNVGNYIARAECEVLSNRIPIRKIAAGHFFIYDRDLRRCRGVRVRQLSSRKQRSAHCCEKVWPHSVVLNLQII